MAKNEKHLMIDLETLGTGVDAAVLTVGALIFDPETNELDNYLKNKTKIDDNHCFYKKVELNSCLDIGCTVDDDTLKWWSQQKPEAIDEAFSETGRENFKDVIKELTKFGRNCKYFWAKGPQFDAVILENAAKKFGVGVPWIYWQLRDVRTAEDHVDFSSKDVNTHNALEDCIYQAIAIQKFFRKVKNK